MTTYIIRELQTIHSHREGAEVECESLTEAKRRALAMQMFHGTVMTIEETNGTRLAYRMGRGRWRTPDEPDEDPSDEPRK